MAFIKTTLTDVGMVSFTPDDVHAHSYLPAEKIGNWFGRTNLTGISWTKANGITD